jgi:hypothetical protein
MKVLLEALDAERLEAWDAMLRAYPGTRQRKEREYSLMCSLTNEIESQVVAYILLEMRNVVYGCYSQPPKTHDLLAVATFPTPRIEERVKERVALAKWYLGYDPNNNDWNPTRVESDIMHTVSILTNAMEMTPEHEEELWRYVAEKGKGLAV